MTEKTAPETRSPTTLDPQDWSAFRTRAHAMLERALDKMEDATDGRVWTPVPEALHRTLETGLSQEGTGPEAMDALIASLLPHGVGNTHPRFFGWVHGAGTPSGLMPAIAEAAMNANCGGRNHAGIHVERQLTRWLCNLFGFPDTASGLAVSGTSMATIIALKTARDRATAFASRADGMAGHSFTAYTSAEAHACIARAFDILGLGSEALRKIPVDDHFRMQLPALRAAVAEDRASGKTPLAIIGTAGTVNTGAIDPLVDLADIAAEEGLWFHVDGAFGACGIMSERLAPRLAGIDRADSIAFDFHKWLHVTYDAGFVLVRDGEAHRKSFSNRPDYLSGVERGLAAANPWPVEYGPELSRGFRALKIWAQLLEFGPARLGAAITANCEQVDYLASLVDRESDLERLAPTETSICCFRYKAEGMSEEDLDALNQEIVIRLQESGAAAPSTTRIRGALAIRVNITNHRTRFADLDYLIEETLNVGKAIASGK
ncbi:pyridoxal phosphate-dependent decarboxylase family protein [Henriciella aquimarina]|uniref:pyridoxal phosphate-dependent decarboxylase family protein n=1 Tax=Henriciella aquimarina TaxID=545261 RepID=UPI0009FD4B2D|nr:pyridoxal-dependent decarboxylase [Henriciella aquimarina]